MMMTSRSDREISVIPDNTEFIPEDKLPDCFTDGVIPPYVVFWPYVRYKDKMGYLAPSEETESTTEQVVTLLDQLDKAETGLDYLELRKQEMIDGVITPEIKQQINDIKVEFQEDIDHMRNTIGTLKQQIENLAVEAGESIDGERKKVIFFSGRTSWDGKKLDGYAAAHPEILQFKKQGKPYASIRSK